MNTLPNMPPPVPAAQTSPQPASQTRGLVRASAILMVVTCLLAVLPFVGFAAWFIVGPVIFISMVIGIIVLARGSTGAGIGILLCAMLGMPAFVIITPLVTSLIGLTGGAAAVGSAVMEEDMKRAQGQQGRDRPVSAPGLVPGGQWQYQGLQPEPEAKPAPGSTTASSNEAYTTPNEIEREAPKLLPGTWLGDTGTTWTYEANRRYTGVDSEGTTNGQWLVNKTTLEMNPYVNGLPSLQPNRFRIVSISSSRYELEDLRTGDRFVSTRQ